MINNILHKSIILGHLPKKYVEKLANLIEQEENNENLDDLIDKIVPILDYDSGSKLFRKLMINPNQSQKIKTALFNSKEVHKWVAKYKIKHLDAIKNGFY